MTSLYMQNPSEELAKQLKTSVYAVARDSSTATCEPGKLASLRIHIQSSRTVCVTKYVTLSSYITSISVKAEKPKPKEVYQWMKKSSSADFKKYALSITPCPLYFTTVGYRNALYLPPGWLFFEQTNSQHDILGIRCQFFGTRHKAVMEATRRELEAARRPDEILQMATDVLSSI